ncbi:MAG: ABC transporter permease [Terriglobales bacterium]|jgi:ABC-type multidrug transport system permease subunit
MATEITNSHSAPQPSPQLNEGRSDGEDVPMLARGRPRSGRWSGYSYLLWVRLLELKREPEIVFWVFGFPLLLSLGLGIAFRNKPADKAAVAVIAGQNAEETASRLGGSDKRASIHAVVVDREAAMKGLRFGKFDVVVEPLSDGNYGFYYDPARPESASARVMANDTLQDSAGRSDMFRTVNHASSEPGSRYIDFLIPGLIGMSLMNSGMWGVGFSLVDMRQRKLLKRFLATPMRRSDFLLAVMSSRLVLMVIEVGLLLVFGMLVFHMPVAGSLVSLALIGSLGAVVFGGVGLLTACRAQKVESVSGLINLVMMPMWIFSGVFFSYEHFPAVAQPFIKALPLTALNDALRAIILEGASLSSQSMRLLIMALWGGISFVLALKWFRWT